MREFSELKSAAEEIKLDDLQKKKILDACKGKKRKRINYGALATVAAVLIITVAVFSPGFLMKAGSPDSAKNPAPAEILFDKADDSDSLYSEHKLSSENGSYELPEKNVSGSGGTFKAFEAENFRSIYSVIPIEFSQLADSDEFNAWSNDLDPADGMAIMQFVEHFEIAKEDFDRANQSYARRIYELYGTSPLYFTSDTACEEYEIFRTDIIYRFDRAETDGYYGKPSDGTADRALAQITVPEEYYLTDGQ